MNRRNFIAGLIAGPLARKVEVKPAWESYDTGFSFESGRVELMDGTWSEPKQSLFWRCKINGKRVGPGWTEEELREG